MGVSVSEAIHAFEFFFDSVHDRRFSKSLRIEDWGERPMLPLIRSFLLGYFRDVAPETKAKLPGTLTGHGSLDFVIGDLAIEFAVRRRNAGRSPLSDVTNAAEIKKLMKHKGLALLVLYDFSESPLAEEDIDRYREWPSLGKGNHKKSPFNVAYFYREGGNTKHIRKNIRVT